MQIFANYKINFMKSGYIQPLLLKSKDLQHDLILEVIKIQSKAGF